MVGSVDDYRDPLDDAERTGVRPRQQTFGLPDDFGVQLGHDMKLAAVQSSTRTATDSALTPVHFIAVAAGLRLRRRWCPG